MYRYGDHTYKDLFFLDPFNSYDVIFAELQKQVLYYNGNPYYNKSWNYHFFVLFFKQQLFLLKSIYL